MKQEDLIPVFVPPLAYILEMHERKKGTLLTEPEVLAIRDKSIAVMLPRSEAAKMTEKRGYQDVDPQNCWEEWQARRVQS